MVLCIPASIAAPPLVISLTVRGEASLHLALAASKNLGRVHIYRGKFMYIYNYCNLIIERDVLTSCQCVSLVKLTELIKVTEATVGNLLPIPGEPHQAA